MSDPDPEACPSDAKMDDAADVEFWEQATTVHRAYLKGRWDLLGRRDDKLKIIKKGLADIRFEGVALEMASLLSPLELKNLLSEILAISVLRPKYSKARLLIQSLPRKWLLRNIEAAAEPLLEDGDDWEYRRLLELYALLDPRLASRLADRAARDARPEVREAGEDFL